MDAASLSIVFVPFRVWSLTEVGEALSGGVLSVTAEGDRLRVTWGDAPKLFVAARPFGTVPGDEVLPNPRRVAPTPGRSYPGLILIAIPDLDATLDEANLLIETQHTLQHATGGLIYNIWNGNWLLPDS